MGYFIKCFKVLLSIEKTSSSGNSFIKYIKAAKGVRAIQAHHYNLLRKYRLTPSYALNNFIYEYYSSRKRTEIMKRAENLLAERKKMREGERTSKLKQIINLLSEEDIFSKITQQVQGYIEKLKEKIIILRGSDEKEKTTIITPGIIQSKFQQYLLTNVKLYHESLKAMIEGQREVLQNPEFKFEDGVTVKEKTERFEKFIKSKMPRFRKKIEVNTDGGEKREKDSVDVL